MLFSMPTRGAGPGRGPFRARAVLPAVAVLACRPVLAWAAEAGHAEEPGILSPRLDLGIWTLVVFGVLFLVLRKYAWGPLLEGLHRRETAIREAIEEARRTRAEADQLRAEFQAERDKAGEQVRQMMDDARREAQQAQEAMLARARTEIQAERDRLRREIETARDQALQQLWNQTAQLATLVSSKAIRRQLTPEDHRRLVDEAIAELREAGKSNGAAG